MRDDKNMIDDMMSLGGNILGNLLAARHEVRAQFGQRAETLAEKLNLVSRAEFDAAFAMLAKSRAMQEEITERLSRIESHLGLSGAQKKVKKPKTRLPSVKKDKLHKRAS